jgi:transposase-like protein
MFTCERCGKDFTEKSNLTRNKKTHLKDATVSGQTYSCGEWDKVFSRADNRKT